MKNLAIFLLIIFTSCQQNDQHLIVSGDEQIEYVHHVQGEEVTVRNSVNWEGKYEGEAACDGCIQPAMSITLYPDNTYEMITYSSETDIQDIEQGSFEWNIQENKIRLNKSSHEEFLFKNEQLIYVNTGKYLKKVN